MTTTDTYSPADLRRDVAGPRWFNRAVEWLDDRGTWAWIGLMVAGFVVFWPLGLAVLAYMIWSKRMFGHRQSRAMACGWDRDDPRRLERRERRMNAWAGARAAVRPSGNAAFDAYKADTLRRLEEEQRAFEEFLGRLRDARDKAEFDQFMDDRARRARDAGPSDGPVAQDEPDAA